ncbi:major facilitator superfamily domain-containing protein [Gorgonomyces haynaldii]|nr:major facilitator superfamily domain-containing protein [Gorgonomyces haynaldii]
MIAAGTLYAFSLFGNQLAAQLDLTQKETAFVGACGNVGVYLSGPLIGTLVDLYPSHIPHFLVFGGGLIFLGYSLVALAFEHYISTPHFLILALYFLIIGLGSSSLYHVSLATNYRNWPQEYRSIAVGITVSCFGLSALVFTGLSAFFTFESRLNVFQYLLFCGIVGISVNSILCFFLKRHEPLPEEEPLLQDDPMAGSYIFSDDASDESSEDFSVTVSHYSETRPVGIPLEEISFSTAKEAYMIAFMIFVVAGGGLMYINNVGAVVLALTEGGPEDAHVHALQKLNVGILSLSSFLGRAGMGFLIDWTYSVFKTPYPLWGFVSCLLMLIGFMLSLLVSSVDELLIVSFVIGVSFGCIWTICPVLVGKFFGQRQFARNWGWMTAVPAFGSQFFSLLFGAVQTVL